MLIRSGLNRIFEPIIDPAPPETEPNSGNASVNGVADPPIDLTTREADRIEATGHFLCTVRTYAIEHGLSTEMFALINAGREWLTAMVNQDPQEFTAWLDEIEAKEIEADRLEAAA